MPTYQYACTDPACGNRFELVQSFTDPSVTECPVCSGLVRKVYGSVGVVFKGSGFYRNDSRGSTTSTAPAASTSTSDTSSTPSTPSSTPAAGSSASSAASA